MDHDSVSSEVKTVNGHALSDPTRPGPAEVRTPQSTGLNNLTTPTTMAGKDQLSSRPSRNRERISYSDFYKIGLGKEPQASQNSVQSPSRGSSGIKSNILKFKVRNATRQEDVDHSADAQSQSLPTTVPVVVPSQLSVATSSLPASTHTSNPSIPPPESDIISEVSGGTPRDRAGTSPLSSVPSDIDDAQDAEHSDATRGRLGHLNGAAVSNRSKSKVIRYRSLQPGNVLKRAAPNLDASEAQNAGSSKNKKIKISSPVKQRKGSPVELGILPQDSRNRSKIENADSRMRAKDDDQGSNDGHCSACQGSGKLLCCDDCPRSFHFLCIEPPIEEADVPDEAYFCMSCWDKRPEPGLFHALMVNEITRDPVIYKLPEEIKSFFDNVSTGEHGEYLEGRNQKVLRKDRHGFAEELDPQRLRDRHHKPILCYKCGLSALGTSGIVACDHCSAYWHFDCLTPPLHGAPAPHKNWTCPLHADDVTPTARRPRHSHVVDVSLSRGFKNAGDVDVLVSEPEDATEVDDRSSLASDSDGEDQLRWAPATANMPRIKYRLPSRGIILDFLDSCHQTRQELPEGKRIADGLPLKSTAQLEALVDVAVQELKQTKRPQSSSTEDERVQLLALKTLLAVKGKKKLMEFLERED